MKLVPQYRKYHSHLIRNTQYAAMNQLMLEIQAAGNSAELSALEIKFEKLATHIQLTWAPAGTKEKYFFMLNALETMRNHFERKRIFLAESERAGLTQL